MSEFPLTWMGKALRGQGLKVRAVRGWKTRGRPFSFDPRGVVFHHTASPRKSGDNPSLGTCVHGRSDLPGPLCHLMIGRDGTVYLVAAGRANHAGLGGPWRNIPKDSANSYTIGVEVEHDGTAEPWSDEMLDTCAKVFATLLVGLHRTQTWLIGHKEWAPDRKIDPRPVEMHEVRHRVREVLARMAEEKETGKPVGKQEEAKGEVEKPPRIKLPPTDIYVVEAGDTLFAIAQQHGTSVEELKRLNKLTGDTIHPGDKLKVTTGK